MNKNKKHTFSLQQTDRIIEMAWEDRTPFDAIKNQFGINEKNVKYILRSSLKLKTYLVYLIISYHSFGVSKNYYAKFEEAHQLYKEGRFRLSEKKMALSIWTLELKIGLRLTILILEAFLSIWP